MNYGRRGRLHLGLEHKDSYELSVHNAENSSLVEEARWRN
jgi:hypothetical protein